eukprot:tig00001467_g8752.t1
MGKDHDIPVGRAGFGCGSLVAWALTITDLDPLQLGLLFERFLNRNASHADFDIDFCETRRGEVIRYVQQKYGATMSPRSSPSSDIKPAKANELFDLIDKFAGYGFNKSHAAAYALLAYQTAWLKAHHPHEFFAASMAYDIHQTDKLAIFADDMK